MNILNILRSGDIFLIAYVLLTRVFVLLCCMPIHECAHAYAAKKCGDDTAQMQGRLTINPFAHLDPFGAIMILLFGIGYANPVPVNPARLKHPRKNFVLISFAGPLSNIVMACVLVVIYHIVALLPESNTAFLIVNFFSYAVQMNLVLAVFNLIPIPPLDGSKILSAILPDKIYFKLMKYDRYIMIALMIILFTGILNTPISFLSDKLFKVIDFIPSLIFGAFNGTN